MSEVPLYHQDSRHECTPFEAVSEQFISQKVFIESFYKTQFPHKSVILLFFSVITKDTLTNLCGN